MNSLLSEISASQPHFVKCIKPNPSKVPLSLNFGMVASQLRYLGVL